MALSAETKELLDSLGVTEEDTLQVKVQVVYKGHEVDAVDMTALAEATEETRNAALLAMADQFAKVLTNIEQQWASVNS